MYKKAKKKKKSAPKHLDTKGRRHKKDTKEQEGTERQERLALYIQNGGGWETKMREHLKVFLHIALVIIRLEPTTQYELLRGLKRQQWYEDWLLPVLREIKLF